MLSNLADRLEEEGSTGTIATAIRSRYAAVIVDEFQDTDTAQWRILEEVFVNAARPFFAVGDPKQSIYGFRGADIDVYLQAAKRCLVTDLSVNHRSDEPLVGALNHLWLDSQGGGDPFDVNAFSYSRVAARRPVRVKDLPPVSARARRPLEIRWFDGAAFGTSATALPNKDPAERLVARQCAQECRDLLSAANARILAPDHSGVEVWRALRPGDLAVLTRTNAQAMLVREELAHLGIPGVTGGSGSIFESEAVGWVLAWLDAVADPSSESAARRVALTPLLGWTAQSLGRGLSDSGEPEDRRAWEELRRTLATHAQIWLKRGFFRVFERAVSGANAWPLLLESVHGERAVTDLLHIAELLHAEERGTRAGPRALAEWLREQVVEADADDAEQAQRLESDASAVQLVTIHSSKGLQYPIALVPFAWSPWKPTDRTGPLRSTQPKPEGGSRVVIDLHPKGSPRRRAILDQIGQESVREDMRLLYVATTRARHHVVLWTGAYAGSECSATGGLLFPPDNPIGKITKKHDEAAAMAVLEAVKERLDALCANEADGVGWCHVTPTAAAGVAWSPRADQGADGDVVLPDQAEAWDRSRPLGAAWLVASYSSLSGGRGVELTDPGSAEDSAEDPAVDTAGDEPEAADDDVSLMPPWRHLAEDPRLLEAAVAHDLPGGTGTGNWLHAVFENLDFGSVAGVVRGRDGALAPDLIATEGRRRGVTEPRWHQRVEELVPGWLTTPLDGDGRVPAGFTLSKLAGSDRLDEMQFDLRLGVGTGPLAPRAPGARRRAGCIDPLAARAALKAAEKDEAFGGRDWLAAVLNQKDSKDRPRSVIPGIAGILTGSIDLAFRTGGAGAAGRYWVCDYKSNQVGGPGVVREWQRALPAPADGVAPRLRGLNYTRPFLAWVMSHSAYHLQALLYTVAMHRLLGQRLGAEYDYDRHVGGHLYLFLRGMAGAETPRPEDQTCLGVWADRWPRQTVLGLDCALLGGDSEAVMAAMDSGVGGMT